MIETMILAAALMAPSAQTHPCDITPPTTFREPAAQLPNLRVAWCHDGKDTYGNDVTLPLRFSMTIGSGAPVDLGPVAPLTGPNAQGFSYYETTTSALAAGIIQIRAVDALEQQSADSSPITLTLLGNPKAPKDTRIVR